MHEADLIGLIYRAAVDDNWQMVMDALRHATENMVSTHIYGHDMATNKVALAAWSGYDPHMMDLYDQHYHTLNVWVPGIAKAPVGSVLSSRFYCADDDLLTSEFYTDWVKPLEDRGVGGGLVIFNDDRRFVSLGGNIRFKDREQAEDSWLTLLERVGPHIRNAFELQRRLSGERLVTRGYLELIDQLRDSIFLLDTKGRIQFRNKSAAMLGGDKNLLHVDRGGVMHLTDTEADQQMHKGLAAIRCGAYETLSGAFLVRRAEALPLTAMLSPFVPSPDATGYLADFACDCVPVAVLTVHDRLRGRSPSDLLHQTFGLTSAEAKLTLALHHGSTLKNYAELHRISPHTVRNQIKSVFEKTGVHRQAELVSLLSRLLG